LNALDAGGLTDSPSSTMALEALIEARTEELASAVRELEAFSYSVAHDLRAPLRAINGFSKALMEDHAELLAGEPMEYLERIFRASERMRLLIDDLLKLSGVGRGEVTKEAIDVSALCIQLGASIAERNPDSRVAFDVDPGIWVAGDIGLLSIALENILDNAWKFTRKNDNAIIRVQAVADGDNVELRVTDNGIGFDMRYHHKLFAPFQRLHSDKEFEGTGIGLVTVARIIARHGGTVSIRSAPQEGTVVCLTLPAKDSPSNA
jgi:signal transduction histidine kinase